MGSEKPNFLSQPVVKNIFMFRNGDPYYEARRIVINQKRVSNFETLLREVTGGIQPPFGAVRNIYTPRGGHKVDCLDGLQSGEQYVAAGRERFKKMDYQQIGSRKRRMLHSLPVPAKPMPPHNRIIVSARFLKPIKEPCTIFVVANGDVLNPAVRLLIHQRMLGQFDRILEMITERMGLRVLGGVRSLYTYEGHQVADGNLLESGQLYVAVGRERFKKLSYSDLLFTKPRGTRRVNGMKAFSLPPIYRFSKQNGNNKSTVRSSESGDGEVKISPPGHQGNNKEHLSSIVREISQARLISLRKKRSGQSMTLTISDNDDQESKADDGNADDKTPQERPAEEKPAEEDAKVAEENGEKAEEQEELAAGNTKEEEAVEVEEEAKEEAEDASASKSSDKEEDQDTNGEKEVEEEIKENAEQSNEEEAEATAGPEEKEDEVKEEVKEEEEEEKEEVTDDSKGEVKSEEQGSGGSSSSDKSQDSTQKEDGSHPSSEGEKDEQGESTEEEKKDKESEKEEEEEEEGSKDEKNDVDTEEEQQETGNGSEPGKTQSDGETKDEDKDKSNSGDVDREEDVSKTRQDADKESGGEERRENGEVSGEDGEAESEAEPDTGDTDANGEKGDEGGDGGNDDKGRKEKE